MANKKTPLDSEDLMLAPLDLDDLDSLFDSPSSTTKKNTPVRDFKTGFKKGFLEQTKTRTLIRSFLRTALPDGYSRLFGAYDDTTSTAKDLIEQLERTRAGDLDIIAAKAQELLPRLKGRASDKLYNRLEQHLKDRRDGYKSTIQWTRDRDAVSRDMAQQNDESALARALEEASGQQQVMFERQEAMESNRFENERAERGVRDRVDQMRFEHIGKQLGFIANAVTQQVAYQDQVTYQFQRKGLEIQYRSYFALRDLRKFAEVNLDIQKRAYEALVRNTGLPDHLKATQAEHLTFGMRQRATNAVANRIYESMPSFLAGLAPGIQQNLGRNASDLLSSLATTVSATRMGEGMGGHLNEQKYNLAGGVAGAKVGDMIRTTLMPMLARKARPGLENLSNRLGGQHNLLSYYMDNGSSLVQDYLHDGQRGNGVFGGAMKNLLRRIVPQFYLEDRLQEGNYQTIDKQAVFNQLTQRSIVEIIPGYLSRMLQEIRMLRTGRDDVERETYDITSGQFVGYSDYLQNASRRIVTTGARASMSSALNTAMNSYDEEGKLSPEAREALAERLLRDASSNGRFDPEKYAGGVGYAETTDAKTLEELKTFFQGKFELDANGKYVKNASNNQRLNAFSQEFQNIRSLSQNPGAEVERLFRSGNQEALRALGLIYTEHGIDRIDYNKIWAMYREGVTGTNPHATPGPGAEPGPQPDFTQQWQPTPGGGYNGAPFWAPTGAPAPAPVPTPVDTGNRTLRAITNRLGGLNPWNNQAQLQHLASLASRAQRHVGGALGQLGSAAALPAPIGPSILDQAGNLQGRLHAVGEAGKTIGKRITDVCLPGRATPVLLARDIATGHYLDVNTDQVIESVDDITGAVKNSAGQEVLTEQEFRQGIYTETGEPIQHLRVPPRPVVFAFKATQYTIKRASQKTLDLLLGKDAFLPGGEHPALRVSWLKQGRYYDVDGQQMTHWDNAIDGVFDEQNNEVVSAEEVVQLINRDGTPHAAAKRYGWMRKKARAAGRFLRSLPGKAARGYWNHVVKPYYGWLGKKMASPFKKRYNAIMGITEEQVDESALQTPTDSLLAKIYSTLDNRLPGEAPRKGSWQEKLQRSKVGPVGSNPRDERMTQRGFFSALGSSLKGLLGKKEEEEEDEGVGLDDANDLKDLLEGDGEDDGKKRRRGKKRGRLGRGWDRVKGWGGKAMQSRVGKFLTSRVGGLGAGLVASALSAPVLIGAAAVGAAAAGGYWLYNRHQATHGDFRELRLLQYGVEGTGDRLQVLELEALLESATRKGKEPAIGLGSITPQALLDAVGIDGEDTERVKVFAKWLELRFKPVFFAHLKGLDALGQTRLPINETDEKLSDAQKASLLQAVKLPYGGNSPYQYKQVPFGNLSQPIAVSEDRIRQYIERLEAKYGKGDDSPALKTPSPAVTAAAAVAAVTNTTATPVTAAKAATLAPQIQAMAKGVVVTGVFGSTAVTARTAFTGNTLTPLQAVRMRAYGLFTVARKDVEALLSAEELAYGNLRIARDGTAEFTGDEAALIQDLAPLFGVSVTEPGSSEYTRFLTWLQYRFMPVLQTYVSAVARQNATVTLARVEAALTASQKYGVANALMAATSTGDGERRSVWGVEHPFSGNADAETLKQLARIDLQVLEQEANKEVVSTPTATAEQQRATQGSSNNTALATATSSPGNTGVMASVKGFFSDIGKGISETVTSAGNAVSNAYEGAKDYFGKSDPIGNVYTGFAAGNGGKWSELPLPSANRSREAAMATLKGVQALTGVDAELLATFCSIESNFDYLIKAKTSSATGWFQFINDTWDWMLTQHAAKYGIPADTPDRKLRLDPRVNALMGAEFLKYNYGVLSKGLGRAPTDTDLYLAHFLGPGTAVQFLKKDKSALAATYFPKQAGANRSIFYKDAGGARTIGEVYALLDAKVAKHRKGGSSTTRQTLQGESDPTAVADNQAAAVAASAGITPTDGKVPQLGGANAQAQIAAMTSQAQATVNPLTVGTGVGMPTPATPAAAPSVSSGQQDPALVQAATAATQQAAAVDRANQERTQQSVAANKAAVDVQERQLTELIAMRGYLRDIAEKMGVMLNKPESATGAPAASSTPTAKANANPEWRSGQTPAPISMSR